MRAPAHRSILIVAAAVAMATGRAAAQYRGYEPRADHGSRGDYPRRPEGGSRTPGFDYGRYGFGGGAREAPPSYARDPRSFGRGPYGGDHAWSRGQYLPPDYRRASVANPARYHLRAPPAGYGWVGDGRNAYLMQRSTGMVLDLVPRAYERPGAAHPRR